MKAWLCSWLSGNMLGMGWVQILFWSNYFFLWVIYGNLFILLVWFLTNEPKLWVELPLWDGWPLWLLVESNNFFATTLFSQRQLLVRSIFLNECISRIFCNSPVVYAGYSLTCSTLHIILLNDKQTTILSYFFVKIILWCSTVILLYS